MSIEIISVGDELLTGAIVNTNAPFLSRELSERGWKVHLHTTLPDEEKALTHGLKEAVHRSTYVIVTGGLGPTLDDCTQACAEKVFQKQPQPLSNSVGSAPGALFTKEGGALFLLPGVPQEMEAMFLEHVLPFLEKHLPPVRQEKVVLHFCLLSEKEIDPHLRAFCAEAPDLQVGIYPGYALVTVKLFSKNSSLLQHFANTLKEKFRDRFIPSAYHKIEEIIHEWFCANTHKLAVAESCTGGALATRLTSVPGASTYFLGSLVTYSNELKEKLLGVEKKVLEEKGAVSSEVVEEMLNGVFESTSADVAIAVSGIAGPTGGSAQKPVGTVWYALGKRGEKPEVGTFLCRGQRSAIVEKTVQRLLAQLWLYMQKVKT